MAFPYVDVVAGAVHLGVGLLAEPVPAHLPHELIHPLLDHSLLPPLLPRIKSVPRPGTAPILFGRDLPARPNRDGDEGWKEPEREGGGSPAAPATSFLFSPRVGGWRWQFLERGVGWPGIHRWGGAMATGLRLSLNRTQTKTALRARSLLG